MRANRARSKDKSLQLFVGGQADVISISSDDMENNDTDDGIIDLTGEDD